MKTITKRKSMGGADDILDKSLIRYIDPPAFYGNTILIWNYRNREKAFWHKALHSSPGRITDTESLRPPAEADFSPSHYRDANPHDENHLLLRKEDYEGNSCYVVESTPRQGAPGRHRGPLLRLGGENGAGHYVKMVHNGM